MRRSTPLFRHSLTPGVARLFSETGRRDFWVATKHRHAVRLHRDAESFTAVTNASGDFYIPIIPLAKGTLTGDLAITPPAPFHGYTITGFQVSTYDGDGNPFLQSFGVGPHLLGPAAAQERAHD